MISTSKSSSITMSTASTTANIDMPSNSTSKSNHDNAPLHIQTANSPNSSLNHWEISLSDPPNKMQHLNTAPSQESADKDHTSYLYLLADIALQDTNNPNKIQNSEKTQEPDTYVCKFILNRTPSQFCNQKFLLANDLKKHMEIHTIIQYYTCGFCHKKFETPDLIKKHESTHIGAQSLVCNTCKKVCKTKSSLSQHMRTHTGEKPYSCKTCGKRFAHSSNVTQHLSTHTGEKPFTCEICGKTFTQASNRNEHIYIHTQNKRFSCDVCGAKFLRKYDLTTHRLKTHTAVK